MQKGIKAKGTDDRMPAGAEDEFTGFLGRTVACLDFSFNRSIQLRVLVWSASRPTV